MKYADSIIGYSLVNIRSYINSFNKKYLFNLQEEERKERRKPRRRINKYKKGGIVFECSFK